MWKLQGEPQKATNSMDRNFPALFKGAKILTLSLKFSVLKTSKLKPNWGSVFEQQRKTDSYIQCGTSTKKARDCRLC